MTKNKGGRPTVFTKETMQKLEQAFAIGCPIAEACFYAGIAERAYYNYKKLNPELVQNLERLRNKPVLKARQTIVNGLGEADNAKWYLERKRKKEFSTRTEQAVEASLVDKTVDATKFINNLLDDDKEDTDD